MKFLKRKDTPESREYWAFVERTARYVRSHALCFTTWCCVHGSKRCPKVGGKVDTEGRPA